MLFRFAIVRSSRTEEPEGSGEVGVEGLHVLQLWLRLDAASFLHPFFPGKSHLQRVESGGFDAVFFDCLHSRCLGIALFWFHTTYDED